MSKREVAATEVKLTAQATRCPQCAAILNYQSQRCSSCGWRINTRRCPYCHHTILEFEDPCHHCGHLEPAEGIKPVSPIRKPGGGVDWLALVFLPLGVAMIIWPDAYQPRSAVEICEPDEIIGCFIDTAWGMQGGIVLISISLLSIMWSLISRMRKNNPE